VEGDAEGWPPLRGGTLSGEWRPSVSNVASAQIEEKFLDCAARALSKSTANAILAVLKRIGEGPSLRELWPLLRRA